MCKDKKPRSCHEGEGWLLNCRLIELSWLVSFGAFKEVVMDSHLVRRQILQGSPEGQSVDVLDEAKGYKAYVGGSCK